MAYTLKDEMKHWNNPYGASSSLDTTGLKTGDLDTPLNHSIKPIDRKDANVEVEKEEIVFTPDFQLLKVRGNTHAKGGTPVKLEDRSFVFSNFKKKQISKKDAELFKFKEGGTPSKVLSKEINIDHHNKMLAILQDPKQNTIAKTTARKMLEKNLPRIGQIAFIQEEIKGFPQGVPNFANSEVPQDQPKYMEQQYKQGGLFKAYQGIQVPRGRPTDTTHLFNIGTKEIRDTSLIPKIVKRFKVQGVPAFETLSNSTNVRKANSNRDKILQFEDPEFQKIAISLFKTMKPEEIVASGHASKDNLEKLKKMYEPYKKAKYSYVLPQGVDPNLPPVKNKKEELTIPITPPTSPVNPYQENKKDPVVPPVREQMDEYQNDVNRSFEQDFSLYNDFYKALSLRKMNPMRIQETYNPLELERINKQPIVNSINNQTYVANRTQQGYSPVQGRSNQSRTFGNSLDAIVQAEGNVYNQNIGISNQEAQINNAGFNAVNNKNQYLDKAYYDEFTQGEASFDNAKEMGRDKAFQNWMNQTMDNQDLELRLNSQQSMGPVWVDPSTNLPVKGISDADAKKRGLVKKAAAPFIYNNRTGRVEHSGIKLDFDGLPAGNPSMNNLNFQQFKEYINGMDKEQMQAFVTYFGRQNFGGQNNKTSVQTPSNLSRIQR